MKFLALHITSLRSCLSKNSLLLVKELLQNSNKDNQLDIACYEILIPIILKRSIYDKKFIKQIAIDTLKLLETCYNPRLTVIFSHHILSQNALISETASKTLALCLIKLQEPIQKKLLQLPQKLLKTLINNLIKGINSPRSVVIRYCRRSL